MRKSISPVCPNCIEPLVENQKTLGAYKNWFVCPKCGFRERPVNAGYQIHITGHTIDRIKFKNSKHTLS